MPRRLGLVTVLAVGFVLLAAAWAPAALVFHGAPGRIARLQRTWLRHLALPLPPLKIDVNLAPCPDIPTADGCASPGVIWLRPRAVDRALLLHELGHQFDYVQPLWARGRFEALNRDRRPWDSAPNGPDEQFAEAWMACAAPELAAKRFDTAVGRYDLAYGYRPTRNELRRACRLISRAAKAGARPAGPGARPTIT